MEPCIIGPPITKSPRDVGCKCRHLGTLREGSVKLSGAARGRPSHIRLEYHLRTAPHQGAAVLPGGYLDVPRPRGGDDYFVGHCCSGTPSFNLLPDYTVRNEAMP